MGSLKPSIVEFPVEILSIIFTYAVDTNIFGEKIWSPASIIASTCVRWRAVTMNTPWIWASLSVNVCASQLWDARGRFHLEKHIIRSQNTPLRVEINFWPRNAASNFQWSHNPYASKMVETILDHSHRWTHFRLGCMDGTHHRQGLLRMFQRILEHISFLPILESMEVHMHARARVNFLETLGGKLTNIEAPLLRSLKYSGSIFEVFIRPPVLESLSFVSLTATYMNVSPKIAEMILFHAFPNLISAHFVVLSVERVGFPPGMGAFEEIGFVSDDRPDPQIVPRLRSLTLETSPTSTALEWDSFGGISRIIEDITCPELFSLTLIADSTVRKYTPMYERHFNLRIALIGFLERSNLSRRLDTLRFKRVPIVDHDLIQVLKRVPSLRTLEIYEAQIDRAYGEVDSEEWKAYYLPNEPNHILTPTLFRMLTYSSSTYSTSEAPILLGLRHIVFVSQTDWPDNSLEEMVRSRVRGDLGRDPIESVVLKVSDGMHHFDFCMMDSLQREEELAIRVVASMYEGEEVEVLGHSGLNYWVLNDFCSKRNLVSTLCD